MGKRITLFDNKDGTWTIYERPLWNEDDDPKNNKAIYTGSLKDCQITLKFRLFRDVEYD